MASLGWFVCPVSSHDELMLEELMAWPDVLVARVDLRGGTDLGLLDWVSRARRDVPVVLLRGPGDTGPLLERWRRGAQDIVFYDANCRERLAEALERAWHVSRWALRRSQDRFRREEEQRRVLVRQRREVRRLKRRIRSAEAQLQVATAMAEDGSRSQEALHVALIDQQTRAQRACREFAGVMRDVAEEVRQPLNHIVSSVGRVLDAEADHDVCREALKICASARLLARLIRDLDEVAAVEDGTAPLEPRHSDVVWLTSHLAERLQQARGLHVDLQIDAGAEEVVVDARRVLRVLMRMLLAEGALGDDSRLNIHAHAETDAVDICLCPVDVGPQTWRMAEILRHQGGSVRRDGRALHLRLPLARGQRPLTDEHEPVFPPAEDTQEVHGSVSAEVTQPEVVHEFANEFVLNM